MPSEKFMRHHYGASGYVEPMNQDEREQVEVQALNNWARIADALERIATALEKKTRGIRIMVRRKKQEEETPPAA
jgi:transcriptional regulator of heat shock response